MCFAPRRLEPPRRSPFPIRSQLTRLAFQVNSDDLGQDGPIAPVPVQGMLDIASRGVVVLMRIRSRVDAAPSGGRAVPELKRADGAVAVPRRTPTGAKGKPFGKVDRAMIAVLQIAASFELLPLLPADAHRAVAAVQR